MNDIARSEVTKRDLARGRNLLVGAWTAPFVMGGIPALVFLFLLFVFGSTPPVAATFLFLGMILSIAGFVLGLGISGYLGYRRSQWSNDLRERIAARGIRAEEIDWFRAELKPSEKRALKEIGTKDLLLADAYRDTLASRLTATRIVKSSKRELLAANKRKNRIGNSNSESRNTFKEQIEADIKKIGSINDEAKQMLSEAEARLQMIEAAAARGTSLADSELALKKLSARTADLPLALRAAQAEVEIRNELEAEESGGEKLLRTKT